MEKKKQSKQTGTVKCDFMQSDDNRESNAEGSFVTEITGLHFDEDLCPEVIFLVPTSSKTQILAVKCLINPCCTGVVAQDFGKLLIDSGYDLFEDTVTTWNSSNGVFKTSHKITLPLGMLPSLCKKRTFLIDINIMPHNNCSYPLVIGCSVMQNLKLDVSVLKNAFEWQDLTVPFVPRGHWTDSGIKQFCQVHFFAKRESQRGHSSLIRIKLS